MSVVIDIANRSGKLVRNMGILVKKIPQAYAQGYSILVDGEWHCQAEVRSPTLRMRELEFGNEARDLWHGSVRSPLVRTKVHTKVTFPSHYPFLTPFFLCYRFLLRPTLAGEQAFRPSVFRQSQTRGPYRVDDDYIPQCGAYSSGYRRHTFCRHAPGVSSIYPSQPEQSR